MRLPHANRSYMSLPWGRLQPSDHGTNPFLTQPGGQESQGLAFAPTWRNEHGFNLDKLRH